MATVTFSDQTATGKTLGSFEVGDLPDSMTLRELIRLRVREEVARHNAQPSERFRGLVQPDDAEAALNGYVMKRPRRIDWERQADVAEQAFARNGFFVLISDRQVVDLDQEVSLAEADDIAFVKLVPLVGG